APGATFAFWSSGCDAVSGPTCSVTMSTARAVTASFSPQTFTLSVSTTGSGSGTVTSSDGGINCGATCSAAYTSGSTVVLTATPAPGSTFAFWSSGCDAVSGPTCSVTMSTARAVTASFSRQTFTLSVSPTGLLSTG